MEEIKIGSFDGKKYFGNRNLKPASLISIVVVLIVLITAGIYFMQRSRSTSPKVTYNIPANLTPNQKALYLANSNQYQAAMQVYKQELTDTNSSSSKLNIYFMMSALALRFNDYSNARLYANEAKLLVPKSSDPYVSLAQLATAEGNASAAKQYWQEAINNLDPNQPGYNLIKEDYQRSMAELK